MATLEYCFAASDDVEETPASSRLPANMLMFAASSVASDGKIRRITHRAFPLSLGMLGGIENLDNTTPDRRSSLGDCLDADQLRPAAEISPASMRHLQTRGEVVPRGDNPRYVLPMRCQMGKRQQATRAAGFSALRYSSNSTGQHVQEVAVTHGAGPHVQE